MCQSIWWPYWFHFFLLSYCFHACQIPLRSSHDTPLLQRLDFEYLTMSAHINYQAIGHNGRIKFRIQKDHIIWFAITTRFGLELIRGMITPSGITYFNRLQCHYVCYDYDTLYTQWHFPCSYAVIQALLLGEIPFAYTLEAITPHNAKQWRLQQHSPPWKLTNFIDRTLGRLVKIAMVDTKTKSKYTILYTHSKKYKRGDLYRHAQLNFCLHTVPKQWQGTIAITNIQAAWPKKPLRFPFSIPTHYEKR